uniref:MYND-type domain-containing protein n=1 Tax=Ditylum brightwellii TaxID=49249 RepID=A0A7S4WCY2_9STRA|mmetsp:Transcript_10839/g.14542  ORF Transcript_10839/g.14542 Transcript_10839/m.14542 type:complete len:396 (+) Transcript_10839:216-1403(+)
MYKVAATYGHARGQYEYALCLLQGTGVSNTCEQAYDASNEEVEEAIQFLCRSSTKGFYGPSYTYLAKTLIDIAEKLHGTVYAVGKSPIPRVLQMLALGMECPYGISDALRDETSKLIKHYENSKNKCSNCGMTGSQTHPLRICTMCGCVAYCSNVCQKRDYRDGHKFDCCSKNDLFNFQSLRLTLPWVSKSGWKREGVQLPQLSNHTEERSLMQMVKDETDEVYGEENQDYDDYVLANLMLRMRQNIEMFLNRESQNSNSPSILKQQIDIFAESIAEYPGQQDFIEAMEAVRKLGNSAAHGPKLECNKLVQLECEKAVREYRLQKERFEKYRERKTKDSIDTVKDLIATKVWKDDIRDISGPMVLWVGVLLVLLDRKGKGVKKIKQGKARQRKVM